MAEEKSHHTGRGGGTFPACCYFTSLMIFNLGGNVVHVHEKEHPSHLEGLADKIKHKIVGDK